MQKTKILGLKAAQLMSSILCVATYREKTLTKR